MIYRSAMPGDGPEMLGLIESHPAGKGMKILYTRRPDAYKSYLAECPDAEITLCLSDDSRVSAQIVCLPRKLYISREAHTVGYVTGLHKKDGAAADILKLLETAYSQSRAKHFFCSILDENKSVYDLLAKRGLIHPICDYATYFHNPAAFKLSKHNFKFRRAVPNDLKNLLGFYNEAGSLYSYFPVFDTMNGFAGLQISDFFILEDKGEIIAAGALWDQRSYKQYIALGYHGASKLAAHCSPPLRFFRYPPLPKVNAAANFAYISFMLSRKNNPGAERIFLGELAAAARRYDFLAIGAVNGDKLREILNAVKNIKIGSKLCAIDYDKQSSLPIYETPFRFECALL